MDINQLQNTYKIGMDEIVHILKNQNITMHLSHWSDIPDDWIELIEAHIKITTHEKSKDKRDAKKSNNKEVSKKSNNIFSIPSDNTFYVYVKYIGPEKDH